MFASSICSSTPLLARFLSSGMGKIQNETIQAVAYHQGDFGGRTRTTVNLFFPHAQQILSGFGLKFSTSPLNFVSFEDKEKGTIHFQTTLAPCELSASQVNTLFLRWQRLQAGDFLTREEYYKERKGVSIDTAFLIDSVGHIPLGVELPTHSDR